MKAAPGHRVHLAGVAVQDQEVGGEAVPGELGRERLWLTKLSDALGERGVAHASACQLQIGGACGRIPLHPGGDGAVAAAGAPSLGLADRGKGSQQRAAVSGEQESGVGDQAVEQPAAGLGGMACRVGAGIALGVQPPTRSFGALTEHAGDGAFHHGGLCAAAEVIDQGLVEQPHPVALVLLQQVRRGAGKQPVDVNGTVGVAAIGLGQRRPQRVTGQAGVTGKGDRDEQVKGPLGVFESVEVVSNGRVDIGGERRPLLPAGH